MEKALVTEDEAYQPIAVQENHYDAWGADINTDVTTFEPPKGRLGTENRFNFLGREEQSDIGMIDLMKRFYNPSIGRFMSVDPSPDIEGQERLSTYQYSWNNPVLLSDPNGDCPKCASDFALWLMEGYYKYVKGGLDYGSNEAKHNTRSDYTERVPERVRSVNHTIGQAKAIQKSVEGAKQIIEVNATLTGVLEVGAISASGAIISAMVKPQGLSMPQFRELSKMLKEKVGTMGDDIFIQGSRASGTAKPTFGY